MKLPELYRHKEELEKAPEEIKALVKKPFSPSVVTELVNYQGAKFQLTAIVPILNGIESHLQQILHKYQLKDKISGPVLLNEADAETTALYFRCLTTIDVKTSASNEDLTSNMENMRLEPHCFYFVVNSEVPVWAMAYELAYRTGMRHNLPQEDFFIGPEQLEKLLRLSHCNFVPYAEVNAKTTNSSDFEYFLQHKGDQTGTVCEAIQEILENKDLSLLDQSVAIEAARKNTLSHASLSERAAILKLYIAQTMACLLATMGSFNSYACAERAGVYSLDADIEFMVLRVFGLADFKLLKRYPEIEQIFTQCLFKLFNRDDHLQLIIFEYMQKHNILLGILELGDASILEQLDHSIDFKGSSAALRIFTPVCVARMLQYATGNCTGPVLRLCTKAIKAHSKVLGRPENITIVIDLLDSCDNEVCLAGLELLTELLALNPTETVRTVHDTPIIRFLFAAIHRPKLAAQTGLVLGRLLEQDQITYSLITGDMWNSLVQTTDVIAFVNFCAGMSLSETGQGLIHQFKFDERLVHLVIEDCFESPYYSEELLGKFSSILDAVPGYLNQMVEQVEPLLQRLQKCLEAAHDQESFELRGNFQRSSPSASYVSHVIMLLGSLAHQKPIQTKLHSFMPLFVSCLTHSKLPLELSQQLGAQKYFRHLFNELFTVDYAVEMLETCFKEFIEFVLDPFDFAKLRRGTLFAQIFFSFTLKKSVVFAQHIVPIILSNPLYKQLAKTIPQALARTAEREAYCLSSDPDLAECFWANARAVNSQGGLYDNIDTSEYELFKLLGISADEYCERKLKMQAVRYSRRGLDNFYQYMLSLSCSACNSSLVVPGLYLPGEPVAALIKAIETQPVNSPQGRYAMAAMIHICCKKARNECFVYDLTQYDGLRVLLEVYEKLSLSEPGQRLFVLGSLKSDYRDVCLNLIEELYLDVAVKFDSSLGKHQMHRAEDVSPDWMVVPFSRALLQALKIASRGVPLPLPLAEFLSKLDTEHDLQSMKPVFEFIEQHWRMILEKDETATIDNTVLMAQALLSLQYSFKTRFEEFIKQLQLDAHSAPLLAALVTMQPQLELDEVSILPESPAHVKAILAPRPGSELNLEVLITECAQPIDVNFVSELAIHQLSENQLQLSTALCESLVGLLPLLLKSKTVGHFEIYALISLNTALKTILETDSEVITCGVTRTISRVVCGGQTTIELEPLLRPCAVASPDSMQEVLENLAYLDPETSQVYLKSELDKTPKACCPHEARLGSVAESLLLWSIRHTIENEETYCKARDLAFADGYKLFRYGAPTRRPSSDAKLNSKADQSAEFTLHWNQYRLEYLKFRFAYDLLLPHCPSLGNLVEEHSPLLRQYFISLVNYSHNWQRREGTRISEYLLSEVLATGSDSLVALALDSLNDSISNTDNLCIVLVALIEACSSAYLRATLEQHSLLAKIEGMIEETPQSLAGRVARKLFFIMISLLIGNQAKEKEENDNVGGSSEPPFEAQGENGSDALSESELDSLADGLLDDSNSEYQSSFYESFFTLNDYEEDDSRGRVMVNPPRELDLQRHSLISIRAPSYSSNDNSTLLNEVRYISSPSKGIQPFYNMRGGFGRSIRKTILEHELTMNYFIDKPASIPYVEINHSPLSIVYSHKFFQMFSEFKWENQFVPNHASSELCRRLLSDSWNKQTKDCSYAIDWSRVTKLPSSFDEFRKEHAPQAREIKEISGQYDREALVLRTAVELVQSPSALKSWGLDEESILALPEEMRLEVIIAHILSIEGPDMTESEILATLGPDLFTDVAYTQPNSPKALELEPKKQPIDLGKISKRNNSQHVVEIDCGTHLMCALSYAETEQESPSGVWTNKLRLLAIGFMCDTKELKPQFARQVVEELDKSALTDVPLDTLFPLLLKPAIFHQSLAFKWVISFIEKQKPSEAYPPGRASLSTIFTLLCSRIIDDGSLKAFIKLIIHLRNKKVLLPTTIEQYTCDGLGRLLDASVKSATNGKLGSSIFSSLENLLSRLVTFKLCSLNRNLDLMVSLAESLSKLIPEALATLNESSLSLLRSYMYVTSVAPQTTPAFLALFESHGAAINSALLESPALLNLCIKALKGSYHVFTLDVKLKSLYAGAPKLTDSPLTISTPRSNLLTNAFRSLGHLSGSELAKTRILIKFAGEMGADGGGLLREWFILVGQDMVDDNYGLFKETGGIYHVNMHSAVENYLELYEFLGKLMARAVLYREPLGCNLNRVVYEAIVKQPDNIGLGLDDLAQWDPDLAKSLQWMRDNDITGVLDEIFVVSSTEFGDRKQYDLKAGGASIAVTEANKLEYISLLTRYKLLEGIRPQLKNLCDGFYSVIPHKTVSLFNATELALVIQGSPEIDVDAWKSAARLINYDANSPVIKWFWQFVRTLSNSKRGDLLRFATGSPMLKQPVKFSIAKSWMEGELPTSSACAETLHLPAYKSYETLAKNLRVALEHSYGFGLV